jgi:hypothetical protein
MRVAPTLLALCLVACGALDAPASMLENTNCGSEQIAEYVRCEQTAVAAITGGSLCESVRTVARCWPKCFCDHPQGFPLLREELQASCGEVPPCGAPAPAPAPSPAPASRASAVPVCIAALVSLVASRRTL